MLLFTIIWTLICATIIIGYPLYLFNTPSTFDKIPNRIQKLKESNTVELISFDIRDFLPGWSVCLDVPQLTDEVIRNNPILFYLESEENCLKLPLNNATFGYTAHVYKNVGKVYVTFKSLQDGVTNFYVPAWHLKKLKILIIRAKDSELKSDWDFKHNLSSTRLRVGNNLVNIQDYEDMLGYFSNVSTIDFKGHYKALKPKRRRSVGSPNLRNGNLVSTG
jgi:hypothetical protein